MATRRRSRGRSKGGRYLWEQGTIVPFSIAAGAQSATNLVQTIDADTTGALVVTRILGSFSMRPEVVDVDNSLMVGIYMMNADALSAGAFPELEADKVAYLFLDHMLVRWSDITLEAGNLWHTRAFDVKAKRKFRSSEQVLVLQFQSLNGAAAMTISAFTRSLIWVP